MHKRKLSKAEQQLLGWIRNGAVVWASEHEIARGARSAHLVGVPGRERVRMSTLDTLAETNKITMRPRGASDWTWELSTWKMGEES